MDHTHTIWICSPIYWSYPFGYSFYLIFNPFGLDSAASTCESKSFSKPSRNEDDILRWLFSKKLQLMSKDQLEPLSTWTSVISLPETKEVNRPTPSAYLTHTAAFAIKFTGNCRGRLTEIWLQIHSFRDIPLHDPLSFELTQKPRLFLQKASNSFFSFQWGELSRQTQR